MADNQKIIARIKELASDNNLNKLSCTQAHKLAEEFNVEPGVIGDLCDELKIKIYGCKLGCF